MPNFAPLIAEVENSPPTTSQPGDGFGTRAVQAYVLTLLMVISALSLIDRVAIGIVQEPIKHTFHLSDFQLGLLGGPAFAILYSTLGLPVAELAERHNRPTIIATSLALWSVATAICGIASSYLGLFAARIGVSIGEAGGNPPSQSLIVDYFPSARRTTALATYGLGTPLAAVIAGFGGGWLAQTVGWRMMFILLAIPGLLLAFVFKVTVSEPPRPYILAAPAANLHSQLLALARKTTLWHLALGASMSCFVGYGLSQYLVSFLMRAHGLTLLQASSFNGAMFGVCAGVGTFGCGYLSDRLGARYPRVSTWLPAGGMLLAAPLYLVGYLSPNLWFAAPFLMLGATVNYFYVGSVFAAIYSFVSPQQRTVATAVTILSMNLIGYGLGPPIIGLISDLLRAHALAAIGLNALQCVAAKSSEVAAHCQSAEASGLRMAIVISLLGYVWAGLHFVASFFTIGRDRAAAHAPSVL